MRPRSMLLLVIFSLCATMSFAQGPRLRTRPEGPPAPPVPAPFAVRGEMLGGPRHWVRATATAPNPGQDTVMLPLSAGLTLISIPVDTGSESLSDALQNLPAGSRVWVWDATQQQFVEGFDQQLPLGQGALLYVPSPTVMQVTGDFDVSTEIPVDLEPGWNLVGVPYEMPLPRSAQNVYAGGVRIAFNDAIDNGDLGPSVYSQDQRGQQDVGPDDSLQPMNAYWVYSTDADLLEMTPPPLLQSGASSPAFWVLEKIGGSAAQFAMGQLFRLMFGHPNQDIVNQINALNAQIQQVQAQLAAIDAKLDDVIAAVHENRQQFEITVKSQAIAAANDDITTYMTTYTPLNSLVYFQQQAATLGSLQALDRDDLTAFSLKMVDIFPNHVNAIQNRILGLTGGTGILDNYYNLIVLGGKGTMQDRYKAMQSYFNTMIGIQADCALMAYNAYDELSQDPQYASKYQGQAELWRTKTYIPALQAEIAKYRSIVDKILVNNIQLPTNGAQPPVLVSKQVQDYVLPNMDFMFMTMYGEAPGLRVRVMVSPDMNPNNFYNVIYGAPGSGDFVFGRTSSRLGSTDSGVWRSVNGTQKYDSWRISPALSIPEFFVRTNWLVTETTVPASGTQVALTLKDNFSLIDANRLYNNAAGNDYGIKVINYGPMGVDNNGNLVPMSSGTLFGSVLLAKRASAASMINVPVGSGGQFQQSGCTTKAQSNVQLNRLAVGNCANGTMSISNSSTFTYGGSSPAPGTLSIYAGFQYAGDLGTSGAGVAVIGPSGPLMSATLNSGSAGVNGALGPINWQAATSNITWQPGQIYTIGFSAYSGPATVCRRVGIFNESKKCDNFWPTAVIGWNGPAVMTFQ